MKAAGQSEVGMVGLLWLRNQTLLALRGQLSQIWDVYMHLVKLTFWQN